MKKIMLLSILSFWLTIFGANAQVLNPTDMEKQVPTGESLQKKAKTQNTVAWILSGVGVSVFAITIFKKNSKSRADPIGYLTDYSENVALVIVGGVLIGASVPLFLASKRNKRRWELIMKNESVGFLHPSPLRKTLYTVGIQIKL